jgi:hypothetical protein
MRKLLAFAALALLLAGCAPPKSYTVTQYRSDGKVQASWVTTNYSASGNCLLFQVKGEPTNTTFYACGNVVGQSDVELPKDPAKYAITQRSDDGTQINRWNAISATPAGGCIQFVAAGDANTTRLACGNVIAEAVTLPPPSPDSPAPYRVSNYKADGSLLQSWRVRSYTLSSGIITFYMAGDSTNTPFYATGNVQAGTQPR